MLLVPEKAGSGATAPINNNAAGPSKSLLTVPPPEYAEHEQAWQGALRNLDTQINHYDQSRRSLAIERNGGSSDAMNIERETQEREAAVVDAMNNVADSHPDPGVRTHWKRRAREFKEATENEKDHLVPDIMKAVMTLITAPLFLAGLILITTGTIIKGIGMVLTGGRYGRLRKRRQEDSETSKN